METPWYKWAYTGTFYILYQYAKLNISKVLYLWCGGIRWVCRRSARSSGQWVGQRRLCKGYIARIEAKNPKTPNKRSGQRCRNSCRTVFGVYKRGHRTFNNPYSDLSSYLRPSIHKSCSPSLSIRPSTLTKVLLFRLSKCLISKNGWQTA